MTDEGTVYLLHFEHPCRGRSRHYLGFTRNLEQRIESHRHGAACATTKIASIEGLGLPSLEPGSGTQKTEAFHQRDPHSQLLFGLLLCAALPYLT